MKAQDLLKAIRDISTPDRVPVLVKLPKDLHLKGKDLMERLGLTWAQLVAIGLMAAIEALETESADDKSDDDFSPGQY